MAAIRKSKRIQWALYVMILPALVLVLVYDYIPLGGSVIAFQRYDIAVGILKSEWIGMENFRYLFNYPNFLNVINNTVFIAVMKIIAHFIVPITISILLNELRSVRTKRAIQTAIYLPHFVSWVIISGIFVEILSPRTGVVNILLEQIGIEPVYFLGNPRVFPYVLVATDIWKEFGYGTIVYLAALTGIDTSLYEAASMDGANRLRCMWHITLPGIVHIMVLLGTLSLGRILNAGFEQVFNMYNPLVYSTGDIIDTLTYRIGIQDGQFDLATAIGLFRSALSLILVSGSYYLAKKFANYRIF